MESPRTRLLDDHAAEQQKANNWKSKIPQASRALQTNDFCACMLFVCSRSLSLEIALHVAHVALQPARSFPSSWT